MGGAREQSHSERNYRPVALTLNVVKVFEMVSRKMVTKYIKSNTLYKPSQQQI